MRTWTRPAGAFAALLVAGVATAGCPGVPTVVYVDDGGAAADAADGPRDAADTDATPPSSLDAATDAARSCPAAVPPGAAACCSQLACYGKARDCSDGCNECTRACAGRICCAKGGGGPNAIRCVDAASQCD